MQAEPHILGSAGASPVSFGALAETFSNQQIRLELPQITAVRAPERIGEAPMRAGEAPALPRQAREHA